ncbi:zinc-binding dehydrogenase [Antrihabitans sp. YC2-6]|uniref:zinc-dependent alcohol dehydrogenase n=1 Tax=Antrihabitans sp. YC2-6 TaxID=2799498 RepID=UPI0018F7B2C9|nr:alcohol dehydrogenase catalytic domain-containing protein [Antrihabitans sp. YC2-6]MBJ8344394.1 alcohol dehydrogenase catalytic domain-containing protein [Antrihabitans sp. YC2-6]
MRELNMTAPGKFRWVERPKPTLVHDDDVIVRPYIVGRCDGDQIPTSAALLRVVRYAQKARLLDPILREGFGPKPYAEPCAIGHECVAEVVEAGPGVTEVAVGDKVVVPYQVSCGQCEMCGRGKTGLCSTTRREDTGNTRLLSWYGHGAATGPYGGMASDFLRVPYANHMLIRIPDGLDPLRVAAASDNLSEAWRCTVPHLRTRPGAKVLVVAGLLPAVGLYAAGIAAAEGAEVDYLDSNPRRLGIAESLGAVARKRSKLIRFPKPHSLYDHSLYDHSLYDIVVDASNLQTGLLHAVRSAAPGGACVIPSYHLAAYTGVPMMHLTFNDLNLHVGMSHPATSLPEVLEWVKNNDFPAEKVTTALVDWDDAPERYAGRTTKLVLHRPPLT